MTPAEVRGARITLGMTQTELAAAIGRSRRMVAYWESGAWPVPEIAAIAIHALLAQVSVRA